MSKKTWPIPEKTGSINSRSDFLGGEKPIAKNLPSRFLLLADS
jgi:hypothetical protein